MTPLSTFSIPVMLHGLSGAPSNLELRKKRGVARLAFNDIGLAGLMGDVDAGYARDVARNSPVCTGHLLRSLQRDLRGDPAVLPRHPGAL